MKFIDEAKIQVIAGKGGDGVASFRRERFIPKGGPNGGDGGNGGSIYAIADRNINTLVDYRFARIDRAKKGGNGRGSEQYGKGSENIIRKIAEKLVSEYNYEIDIYAYNYEKAFRCNGINLFPCPKGDKLISRIAHSDHIFVYSDST